jgi:histidine triad (HIT) family protein
MANCVFCDIVAGKAPARKIYEDDNTLTFLDAYPISRGHTLVIPKRHVPLLTDLEPADWQAVSVPFFKTVYAMARKLKAGLGCSHVSLILRGMRVPHIHMHLVPSYPDERNLLDLLLKVQDHCQPRLKPAFSDQELEDIAARIKSAPVQ